MDVDPAPAPAVDAASAEPVKTSTDTWQGVEYNVIEEGKARILYPKGGQVFYNPIQEYNRDMSVMMLRLFAKEWRETQKKPLTILEALAATGLRSVRYAKEIDDLEFVIANDLDKRAVAAIHRNREYNGVDESKLRTTLNDAAFLMVKLKNDINMQSPDRLDNLAVVDLDPFGGASPFLDGATSLISEGGLLCVTCTDLAVLCGNHAEACFAKYGAMPPKRTDYCHEMALRIILGSIASHAARHHRYIEPVMSMFADFYVRVFVRVYKHGGELKKVPARFGYVMQCTGCDAREIQRVGKFHEATPGNVKFSQGHAPVVDQRCQHCDAAWKMGGPMWMDPIHDRAWLTRALDHLETPEAPKLYGTYKRMLGTINVMLDELPDQPFFYSLSQVVNTLHLTTPKLDVFRSGLVSLGYKVSGTHCAAGAVKTDAPYDAICDVLRAWHKQQPAKLTGLEKSPAYKILSKEPTRIASLDIIESARVMTHSRNGTKLERYPVMPANWGPGSRAGKKRDAPSMAEDLQERRRENQGHRTAKKKAKDAEAKLPAEEHHVDASAQQASSSVRIPIFSRTTKAILHHLRAIFKYDPRSAQLPRNNTPPLTTSLAYPSRTSSHRAFGFSRYFSKNTPMFSLNHQPGDMLRRRKVVKSAKSPNSPSRCFSTRSLASFGLNFFK